MNKKHLNKTDLFYLYEFRKFMKRKGVLKEWENEFFNSKGHFISTLLGVSPDQFKHLSLFDIGHCIKAKVGCITHHYLETDYTTFLWSTSKKGHAFWLDIFKQFGVHLSKVNTDMEHIDILYNVYNIYDKD